MLLIRLLVFGVFIGRLVVVCWLLVGGHVVVVERGLGGVDWLGGVLGRRVRLDFHVVFRWQSLDAEPGLDQVLVWSEVLHLEVLGVLAEQVVVLVAVVVPPASQVNLRADQIVIQQRTI